MNRATSPSDQPSRAGATNDSVSPSEAGTDPPGTGGGGTPRDRDAASRQPVACSMHNDESSLADTPDDAQRADTATPAYSWWPLTGSPRHESAAWLLIETDRGRVFETRPFCLEHAQVKLEGSAGGFDIHHRGARADRVAQAGPQ